MLAEAVYYSRMTYGIWQWARSPAWDDPDGWMRDALENRNRHFLDVARRVYFSSRVNPCASLFQLAGCEYGDLEREIRANGLEPTLERLRKDGVYLTHAEFKGHTPIVRSGREIPYVPGSFRNQMVRGYIQAVSSGSRSRGMPTPQNAQDRLHREVYWKLLDREFGLRDRIHIQLMPGLPTTTGLSSSIRTARTGTPVERWFSNSGTVREEGHYRIATKLMLRVARAAGARVPDPVPLPRNDFRPVAEWIAARRKEARACFVRAQVSSAVRVAAAAAEHGFDIRGTIFLVLGEAITQAKRAVIESAGAEAYPSYGTTEVGIVGHACRQMGQGNCVHFHKDALAVATWRRPAPISGIPVDSLLYTTLLPFACHHVVNLEMDDSGVVEPAACDCEMTRAGFTTRIRDIYSFGKLTGQGTTLLGTDLLQVLEHWLPEVLGGCPGDYQLVEHEGKNQTQMTLRVSPRVRLSSAEAARDTFLKAISRYSGGSASAMLCRHAQSIEVEIAEPFVTRSGKVLSLHLLGDGHRGDNAA